MEGIKEEVWEPVEGVHFKVGVNNKDEFQKFGCC